MSKNKSDISLAMAMMSILTKKLTANSSAANTIIGTAIELCLFKLNYSKYWYCCLNLERYLWL